MIAFPCPKCRATLKAPEERIGAHTKCPYCGIPVQVLAIAIPVASRPASSSPVSIPPTVSAPLVVELLPANTLTPGQRQARVVAPDREAGKSRVAVRPKRPGFPLWLLAVIVPGVLLLCGGGIGLVIIVTRGENGGRDEMTLAAYLVQQPKEPTTLTVWCKLGNYYNFAYRESAATHYNVHLSQSSPFRYAYAWVSKDSEDGRRIFKVLKDGQEHRLRLKVVLQGPDGMPTPPGREEMAITKVVE
jgi:hypothetical protein